MISDTCPCGSSFSVDDRHSPYEQLSHGRWMEEHQPCREAAAARLQTFADNSYTVVGEAATLVDEIAVWNPDVIVGWEPTAPLPPVVDKVGPKTPPPVGDR